LKGKQQGGMAPPCGIRGMIFKLFITQYELRHGLHISLIVWDPNVFFKQGDFFLFHVFLVPNVPLLLAGIVKPLVVDGKSLGGIG